MTEKDINALMTFPNIVHNRKKLEAIVSQAKGYLQIEKEYGSFSKFYGHMLMDILLTCTIKLPQNVLQLMKEQNNFQKDLKAYGFKF